MESERQNVVLISQMQQHCPKERAFFQIEWNSKVLDYKPARFILYRGAIVAYHMVLRQHERLFDRDYLDGIPGLVFRKRGAQDLMAGDR